MAGATKQVPVGATASGKGATVVISQRVRSGKEDEYLRWQREMDARAGTFAGFQATELVPPVPGVQDDFVVIFRFDSFAHLDAWLASSVHQEWLERGAGLFEGPADVHVLASQSPAPHFASMLVSTKVKPGREREYQEWQRAVDAEARKFSGFQGNEVFPPLPGRQEEWVVVVRFDSAENLERWFSSDARRRLLEQGEPLFERVQLHKVGSGFPGWFSLGHGTDGPPALPPNWKQAMTVLLVLYPTVMILTLVLSPRLASLPLALSMFIGNTASVAVLTWLLMPVANRALEFWLCPDPVGGRLRSEALGIGAIVLAYAASIALFLWVW